MKIEDILKEVEQKNIPIHKAISLLKESKKESALNKLIVSSQKNQDTLFYKWEDLKEYFNNHTVYDVPVLFGMLHLSLIIQYYRDKKQEEPSIRLKNILFEKPIMGNDISFALSVKENTESRVQSTAEFDSENKFVSASAQIDTDFPGVKGSFSLDRVKEAGEELPPGELYALLTKNGIHHEPYLQCIQRAYKYENKIFLKLNISKEINSDSLFVSPVLLNAGYFGLLLTTALTEKTTFLPLSIKSAEFLQPLSVACSVFVEQHQRNDQILKGDIYFFNEDNTLAVMLNDVTAKKIERPQDTKTRTVQAEPVHSKNKKNQETLLDQIINHLKRYIAGMLGSKASLVNGNETFLNLGLESGQLINSVRDLENDLGITLYPTLFFEYQTIEELAKYIEENFHDKLKDFFQPAFADTEKNEEVESPEILNKIVTDVPQLKSNPAINDQSLPQFIQDRDIAVIGMGGRFPQSKTVNEFWENLEAGKDMVSEIPSSRWNMYEWFASQGGNNKSYSKWGSFIDDISLFDADFFNVSPREAKTMDPQLRLLLQVMYHTAEDAGKMKNIKGSETGVYVGACFREYWDEMIRTHKTVDSYDLTGSAMTFLANRPAYYFNLKGPSITVDNACSSSLVALHMACQGLILGDCDMAFVAGVNLLISPLHYLHFSSIQALSHQGRCFAFDEKADGYVPGEAICAVLLKPLKKALEDGDPIRAVIKGTATNHGGKSNSLTAPNISQQVALLDKAWTTAAILPQDITYLEAHGTGTKLGDPIEVKALNNAFSKYTDKKFFCALGSAKAHLGHTEGAAGLVSVIKSILMMEHAIIPSMPNFTKPNPLLEIKNSPLYINTNTKSWDVAKGKKRMAAINSFGIGGGYAHAILEESPLVHTATTAEDKMQLLVFSARTEESLNYYLRSFCTFYKKNIKNISLTDLSYTLMQREEFGIRTCWLGSKPDQLLQDLSAFESGDNSAFEIVQLSNSGYEEFSTDEAEVEVIRQEWMKGTSIKAMRTGLYKNAKILHVPGYVFDEKNFWFESSIDLPAASKSFTHPLIDEAEIKSSSAVFKKRLQPEDLVWSAHRIKERNVLPGVAHLEMARAAGELYRKQKVTAIKDHYWFVPVSSIAESLLIYIKLEETNGKITYQITDDSLVFSSGTLFYEPLPVPVNISLENALSDCFLFRTGTSVYDEIKELGAELSTYYQTIKHVHGGKHSSVIEWKKDSPDEPKGYKYSPAILDAFNHGIRAIEGVDKNHWGLKIPYHLKEIQFYADTLPAEGYINTFYNVNQASLAFKCHAFDKAGKIVYKVIDFIPQNLNKKDKKQSNQKENNYKGAAQVTSEQQFIENKLRALVGEVLEREIITIKSHVNLADYGLDSVSIAQFIKKVNLEFKIEISPAVFFEYKTLTDLASFLRKEYKELFIEIEKEFQPELDALIASVMKDSTADLASASAFQQAGNSDGSGEIAIIGMEGIFPGSDDLDEFWEHLKKGDCMIGEIPAERFDWKKYVGDVSQVNKIVSKSGGFIKDIDCFDAPFFGISRHEAELMDPQQRLLMQVVWKTIERAGYAPSKLRGTNTGIFVGVVNNEYYELLNEAGVEIEAHTSTGMARCILPNRVSSYFDWHGPSEPVDTACSSSLVAIHRAAQSIFSGECEMAVAGGINMLLTPKLFVSFSRAGMLSEDGLCKTFDKDANGYVRGEGIGMVILKKLDTAIRDNDTILAVIKGSGVNHGGQANSLTTPNPNAQAALLKSIWQSANILPHTITCLEAHGTGTPLGDPVEINGIKLAFSEAPIYKDRTGIGSVKSNIGHLESAAGIAGLIKVILSMKHQIIPATIHFKECNPYIVLENSSLYIASKPRSWQTLLDANNNIVPRRAGINSFGFGGANAHILLEEFSEKEQYKNNAHAPLLFVLSAKTQIVLKNQAILLLQHLTQHGEKININSLSYTLTVGRDQLSFRWGVIAESVSSLIQELTFYVDSRKGNYKTGESTGSSFKIDHNDPRVLLENWIKGGEAVFERFVSGPVKRIALPSYPFEKLKYWVPSKKVNTRNAVTIEKTKQHKTSVAAGFVEEVTNAAEIEMILGN